MLDSNILLAQRYAHERPGLSLIAIDDAALPVTVVTCDVLAQERKPLPLLDEYLLRLVSAGIEEIDEIANILGLQDSIVELAAAERMSDGSIQYEGAGNRKRLLLTEYGRYLVAELAAVQPVQQQFRITFDRMTWKVADYPRAALMRKRDVQQHGLLILPASNTTRIGEDDIPPRQLNQLLGGDKKVEVLAVRKARPSSYSYFPVKVLIYADPSRAEVELGVIVEDTISREHGMALQRVGGAAHLKIEAKEPLERPLLENKLEDLRVPQEQVDLLRKQMNIDLSESAKWYDVDKDVRDLPVRSVNSFEHPYLLAEALESTARRLLIFSPRLESSVMDSTFFEKVERRLSRGVSVHIGYCDDGDRGLPKILSNSIRELRDRYPNRFNFGTFTQLGSDILIFDDTLLLTNFNLLSYRSPVPHRTYQKREGTLIRLADYVDFTYREMIGKFTTQESKGK